MKQFAGVMDKALVQMKGIETFSGLNSLGTLRKIVDKLPHKAREDWVEWSSRLLKKPNKRWHFVI